MSRSELGGTSTARMASTAKKGGVDPGDFMGLDALLTEEERAVWDEVHTLLLGHALTRIAAFR